MKMLASVLVLLSVVGVGETEEKDIVARLNQAGVTVTGGSVTIPATATGIEIGELCELRDLSMLVIEGGITDNDLRTVCALRRLAALSLQGTRITDKSLREVSFLPELKYLALYETYITDKGLSHLERLSNLQILHLRKCPNVTDEGVARLKKALPNCDIYR
jgi:hypothetical protein